MNLKEYVGKMVRLIDIDGDIFTGHADIYHYDYDTASGIAALTFLSDDGRYLDFDENEIAHIEIISDSVPVMAKVV